MQISSYGGRLDVDVVTDSNYVDSDYESDFSQEETVLDVDTNE